jgi:hypothetical protein
MGQRGYSAGLGLVSGQHRATGLPWGIARRLPASACVNSLVIQVRLLLAGYLSLAALSVMLGLAGLAID